MPKKQKAQKEIKYKKTKERSLIMSAIRSSNTKPELIVRKLIFSQGYRYRLHYKILPGSPDLALTKQKIAIFVQGCFWHYHGCHISHIPKSNSTFWQKKIKRNLIRDKKALDALLKMGWRVLFIWECALMTRSRLSGDILLEELKSFFNNKECAASIIGK